ncbi:MAG: hypothetical protein EH225_11090 [Calditrichaeota bacterium]|nr:hypothetical protein [Calditrichota bacterium]RQV99686.1 MAG: hypothetical protein EH225_11090 [Calditrichota bacterium]
MEKETVDLRELVMMIKEKKGMDASLALEFDCKIEIDDIEPLVKVINYSINYINQLSEQRMQIALYAGEKSHSLAFTTFTSIVDFPPLSEKIPEALQSYNAEIVFEGDPGKFAQIQLKFHRQQEEQAGT